LGVLSGSLTSILLGGDRTAESVAETATSRQRVMSLMINWANMLHPFPELPIVDKVSVLTICSLISDRYATCTVCAARLSKIDRDATDCVMYPG
jgi:hypothetical protein